jgi:peptide/nickel transport system permease protein
LSAFVGGVRARRTWTTLTSTPLIGLIGIGLAIGWMVVAAVGPVLAPYDPLAQSTATLASPGFAHFFGTDELGRDVFSRVIWGARISVTYPILIVGASVAIGGLLGVVAGYFGGWVDGLLMRVTDLVFAFPTIILAMAIAAALGPDLKNSVIAIVAVTWPNYTRVVRSLVLSSMQSDFVLAARLVGSSSIHAMVVDVLPNVVAPVLVFAAVGVGNAMLVLAGLSFLGLGSQPPTAEWGSMITEATNYYTRWWLALFPGLAIISVVFSLNLLGDRLRDVLDPRLVRA